MRFHQPFPGFLLTPGASRHDQKEYQAILDSLAQCGVVVAIAAGNASSWVAEAQNAGYLYADDVSMDMVGSPGSYTNSLCVASIDNAGVTGEYFTVGENVVVYTRSTGFENQPLATIAGEHEYLPHRRRRHGGGVQRHCQ